MPYPTFRLAAIDLDGTLLGPDGRVGARNRAAIGTLREAGITVVIASGRMHAASEPTWRDLGLDTPVVSYNGAMVYNPATGEMISHTPLDADIASEVVEWAADEGRHLNYYLNDHLYVAEADRWSDLYHSRTGSPIEPVGALNQFDGEQPTKIILVDEPHETLACRDLWVDRLGDRAYIVRTAVEYLEFLHPDVNKWAGVQAVARRYGIPDSQVATFGDSPNDLPMIVGAALGVVMPYSPQDILEAADVIGIGSPEDAFGRTVEMLLA
ncbi:MAG TPA: Cof-type HAD-IIB family hydrolase [Armatimonadota bacterium]